MRLFGTHRLRKVPPKMEGRKTAHSCNFTPWLQNAYYCITIQYLKLIGNLPGRTQERDFLMAKDSQIEWTHHTFNPSPNG